MRYCCNHCLQSLSSFQHSKKTTHWCLFKLNFQVNSLWIKEEKTFGFHSIYIELVKEPFSGYNTADCVVRIQSPQPLKNAVHRTSLSLTPFLPLQKGLLLSRPHKAELRINDSTFESAWQMLVITIRSPLLARIKSDGAVFSRFPQLLLRVGFATTSREFLKRAWPLWAGGRQEWTDESP